MGKLVSAVTKPITSILGGAETPKISIPEPAEVAPMPTTDDAAVTAAKRRRLAAQQQRSGRASTLLSEGYTSTGTSDTLG